MQVTVIAPDKLVLVDGNALELPDFEFDETLHAIQFDGQQGHIEFETSDGGISTAPVSALEIQPYVEAWQAEKARLDQEAANAPTPPPPTYAELRQSAILEKWPMAAQLEALTEAAENPVRSELLDALLSDIQQIKAQYPKPDAE